MNIKSLNKREDGVTMVALVVTVIILLVLAGISLKAIVGDSNVLDVAQKSSLRTREEAAKEEVKLAWTDLNTDYLTDDEGKTREQVFTLENLNAYIKDTGKITNFEFVNGGISKITYIREGENGTTEEYYVEIENNGHVVKAELVVE